MEDRDFSLASGAKLKVGMAPFEDAKNLHDKILKALVGSGVGGIDLKALQDPGQAGTAVFDAVLKVASNKDVEDAIFACGARALYSYDGRETSRMIVDRSLFNDNKAMEKAREDFYMICMKIMEVNLAPFLKAISFALGAQPGMIATILASTSKSVTQSQ